jgi:hypothetical protein
MKDLWLYWGKTFFIEPLGLIVCFSGLAVSIQSKNRKFRYFPFYFALYSLTGILICVWFFLDGSRRHLCGVITRFTDHLFTWCEFFIFLSFMNENSQSLLLKKTVGPMLYSFSIFFVFITLKDYLIVGRLIRETRNLAYTIEAILLIISGIFFFKSYFEELSKVDILKDSSFWIITGILFFTICTLPYSFLESYIRHNDYRLFEATYSIFYFFYVLLFLMIIKGLLCRPIRAIS